MSGAGAAEAKENWVGKIQKPTLLLKTFRIIMFLYSYNFLDLPNHLPS